MAERISGDTVLVSEGQLQEIVGNHDFGRPQTIAVMNEADQTFKIVDTRPARKLRFSLTHDGQNEAQSEARASRLSGLALIPAAVLCYTLIAIDRILTHGIGSSDQATAAFGTAGSIALATSYYFNRTSNGLRNTANAIGNYISHYGEQTPTQV